MLYEKDGLYTEGSAIVAEPSLGLLEEAHRIPKGKTVAAINGDSCGIWKRSGGSISVIRPTTYHVNNLPG